MIAAMSPSFADAQAAWPFAPGALQRIPIIDRAGRWRRSRGIIIDLDDTLYPLGRFVHSGFAAVAAHVEQRFGVPADDGYALLARCAREGYQRTAFQSLCAACGLDADTVPALVEVYRAHRPKIFLGHAARTLLRDLRGDGWRIAVLTNGLPSVQARKVEALGLGELVDHVIYAEHFVPGGKPSATVFIEALRRLGTRADRTVCVGDDLERDVAGGRAAGLSTIRLAVRHLPVPPERDADIVVHTLTEVPLAAMALIEGVTRHVA
jgi:putative hydrolase of the HAD superfamily